MVGTDERFGFWRLIGAAVMAAGLLCIGCGEKRAKSPVAGAQLSVADGLGRSVKLAAVPRRIVTLAPSAAETVCLLGAFDRLVGVDTAAAYPPKVRQVPKVGDFLKPNVEKVIALRPDLIVIVSDFVDVASADGLASRTHGSVAAFRPRTLEDVPKLVRTTGRLLGVPQKGEEEAGAIENRIASVEAKVTGLRRVTVFFELSPKPLMSAGRNTLVDQLIAKAGGRNIAGRVSQSYPVYSLEALLAANPEVYVYLPSVGMGTSDDPLKRPELARLECMRQRKVYGLDADCLLQPGPRIAKGLEDLARTLHPEAFLKAPSGKAATE